MSDEVRARVVPEALRARVTYQSHNFMSPQPVAGASAYLLMQILHNWSDKYCVRILQQLVPALAAGSRVLIVDRVVPEPGEVPDVEYHEILSLDLIMMEVLNAKERSLEETRRLFEQADPRFKWGGAYKVGSGPYTIMELVWDP